MMKAYKSTSKHEQCLRDQVITADQPGTVLRDFRMLLDFLGLGGSRDGREVQPASDEVHRGAGPLA